MRPAQSTELTQPLGQLKKHIERPPARGEGALEDSLARARVPGRELASRPERVARSEGGLAQESLGVQEVLPREVGAALRRPPARGITQAAGELLEDGSIQGLQFPGLLEVPEGLSVGPPPDREVRELEEGGHIRGPLFEDRLHRAPRLRCFPRGKQDRDELPPGLQLAGIQLDRARVAGNGTWFDDILVSAAAPLADGVAAA